MSKVSVLIAIYNAEPYLAKCLDSLTKQTLGDIQIICIDDGSTDGSPHIMDMYAKQDDRIRTIRLNENHGQAHARNVGLAIADGEFVCMLDADDWFSPDALERAVETFRNHERTDAVLFDVIMEYEGHSERYEMPTFEAISGEEAFKLSLTWSIHGLYMVRAEIHKKIPYDETCKLYSDDNTTRLHYMAAHEVRRCLGQYHYRQHSMSSTHKVSSRRFECIRANESMRRQMEQLGVCRELMDLYENSRWLNMVDTYMFYHCHGHKLTQEERSYGNKEIKRAWYTIDKKALKPTLASKFGYRPMPTWTLFRLQEWAYFTIRSLIGKNH